MQQQAYCPSCHSQEHPRDHDVWETTGIHIESEGGLALMVRTFRDKRRHLHMVSFFVYVKISQ